MRIVVGGDFCPVNRAEKQLSEGKDIFTKDLQDFWNAYDYRVANLECPITKSTKKILKSGPNLKAGTDVIIGLKQLNFSGLSLANNHIMDYGIDGMNDTCDVLDSGAISWFGIEKNGKPFSFQSFERNNTRVAILSYSIAEFCLAEDFEGNGARSMDLIKILEDIQQIRAKTDHIVVLLHTGLYQLPVPTPRQRELCHFLVKNGVSAVLCQHSHICGAYEYVGDAFISYGQGSFLFDLNKKNSHWNEGYLVCFNFTSSSMSVSLKGTIQFNDEPVVSLMNDEQQRILDKKLDGYNAVLSDRDAFKKEFRKAANAKRQSYYGIMLAPSSRIFNALARRMNFGKLVPQQMKRTLLNLYRNEEHNELIQEILKSDLK